MMITNMDIAIDNALAFRIDGKITQPQMVTLLEQAKEKIAQHGQIVILQQIDSFDGIELSAIVEEFKYLLDVGMANITKVAILTDKNWIKHLVKIEDFLFSKIEMKCFPIEQHSQAVDFLKSTAHAPS